MPITAIPDVRLFGGLDLGQTNDRSAFCLIVRTSLLGLDVDPVTRRRCETVTYDLRFVERWPLGTSYPAVVDRVSEIYSALALRFPGASMELAFDSTGVGKAVADLIRVAAWPSDLATGRPLVRTYGVSIHGGDRAREANERVYVPKRDLIAALVVLFQRRALRIASNVAHQDVLVNELLNFRGRMSATGHDTYSNAGGVNGAANDDLVSAAAFAAYRATLRLNGPQYGPLPGCS